MTEEKRRLVIFAKAPISGHVKTRLQPEFSPEQSMNIHKALVKHSLNIAVKCPSVSIELWVGSEHSWWEELSECYPLSIYQQQGDNLGERMFNAATQALTRGNKVVIIGTDCPFLSPDYLMDAFLTLSNHDVVLGPAEDGGYVLIGLTKALTELFAGVAWGSDKVLQQTQQNLHSIPLTWIEKQTLRDIDRPEDIIYLNQTLPQLLKSLNL